MRAMVCLARQEPRRVSTGELADVAGVPSNYLAKVLQSLAAAALITGRRGIGGGYRLARAPADITLVEIIRAIGGLPSLDDSDIRDGALAPLHAVMDEARSAAVAVLGKVTLADLMNESNAQTSVSSV